MSSLSGHAIVTGATGFVGRVLVASSLKDAVPLALGSGAWREGVEGARWRGATVFHLAARAHRYGDPESVFERDNVDKTLAVGRAAAKGGSRRFVFLSTIKVNGEETRTRAFSPDDAPSPSDAYARSKWKAEQALRDVCQRAGLPLVIVRSPLVIGPGAKGNLAALMRLADGPWPLPFAAIDNRRTFVCVEDLAALLAACGTAPEAAGRTLLAGDPAPVSTPRLVEILRRSLGRPARLFGVSPRALESLAFLAGTQAAMKRLTRSLEVDVSATMRLLDWRPAIEMDAAIANMARAYRKARVA